MGGAIICLYKSITCTDYDENIVKTSIIFIFQVNCGLILRFSKH